MGKLPEQVIEAELLPQLVGHQHAAVLAHGGDLQLPDQGPAGLRRGELAEMPDQSVDLLCADLVTAAQGAQGGLHDLAPDASTLDDVDVLVGALSVRTAADADVHDSPAR